MQFASALAVAERHGKAASTDLDQAAKLLVADQKADGSWTLDQSQSIASPATYGTIIATWSARTTLISSGMQPDNFTIVQADRWIRGITAENVIDAAATVLALELASDVMAENLRRNCLSILRTGQSPAGGWGPYVTAAPQVFDTAMAVLALSMLDVEPRLARSTYRPEELKEAIAKGKAYLASQQRPDGSWPETTRPANQESYAQRISTTGWAMLALLAELGSGCDRIRQEIWGLVPSPFATSPPVKGSADQKRYQRFFWLSGLVRSIELIDLERAADPVAGKILQHAERHDVVRAGLPEFLAA